MQGGLSPIPGRGTSSHMPQQSLTIPYAETKTQRSQINKYFLKYKNNNMDEGPTLCQEVGIWGRMSSGPHLKGHPVLWENKSIVKIVRSPKC